MTTNLSSETQHSVEILRALLNTQKHPITLNVLMKEYREMEGKMLPFKNCGFKTAEQFLKSTGQFLIINDRGEVYVSARPNKDSLHIADMVAYQKPSRKRSTRTSSTRNRIPTKSDQSWNKSSYSSNVYRNLPSAKSFSNYGNKNRRGGGNDKWMRSNSSNQRNGDSNNNTNSIRNRNVTNSYAGRETSQTSNARSVAQPQPVTKPDLRERLNIIKEQQHQPIYGQQNQQQQQQSQPQKQSQQQQLQQKNNIPNIYGQQNQQQQSQPQPVTKRDLRETLNIIKEQQQQQNQQQQQQQSQPRKQSQQQQLQLQQKNNIHNNKNNEQKQNQKNNLQNINGKRQQQSEGQKLSISIQTTAKTNNGALSSLLGNRLENVRTVKIFNMNNEKDEKQKVISKSQVNKTNKTSSSLFVGERIGSRSIQDRLKIQKLPDNEIITSTPVTTPPTTPPTSPLHEYNVGMSNMSLNSSGSDNSNRSSSRQSSQDSLNNFASYMNIGKSTVINNKETNKTKKVLSSTEKYEFDPRLNSIISLIKFCSARGFKEPQYDLLQPKFTNFKHVCSVKVNGVRYTTYPKYFKDPEIAKAAAAAIAIEEIKIVESKMTSYPVCTESDSETILKIYQELKENYSNGIFTKMLPKIFESKFQQTLPDHWLPLIENSNYFTLESTIDNQNTIMFANLNLNETNALPLQEDELIIDPLVLPLDNKYWNVYITHCASTVEIWARIVDKEYSEQLDSLLNDIDMTMLTDKTRPGSLTTGQMYLVCISECWHRVRLERMDKAIGKCLCFFIDFGDDDWISMDQLFICDKKFLKLPPQAIPFSLFGLEDFAENPTANQYLNDMFLGKTLIAQRKNDIFGSTESLNDCVKVQVVLYDTSSVGIDLVLNSLLIDKICDDTPVPELKQNSPTNANITHISDNGDVYLHILDSGLSYVQKLISQLVESKFQKEQYRINSEDIKISMLYLIHDKDDNKWYRGCLADNRIENIKARDFKIFYVDFGLTKQVNITNIFRLESLSTALSRYPRQVLKAKMYNIPPLNEFVITRLKALLPSNSIAIVKLAFNKLDIIRNVIPHIVIFIRVERNQSLCNVNDAIRLEHELMSNDFNEEIFKSPLQIGTNISSCSTPTTPTTPTSPIYPKIISDMSPCVRSLSARSPITIPTFNSKIKGTLPKLSTNICFPEKGEIFNVLVTIASNPFNFFVRPYDDFLKYQIMMTELQSYCQDNDEFIPDDMIEAGEAYAVLLNDGFYYRCIMERSLPDQMCVVYFCDCGDRNVVNINTLRTLPPKCRELPIQAVQAKLHGIKPIKGEWSLEDSIRFSNLTVGQKFASVVQNISIDDFDPNKKSTVLELILIDVLTSKDIYVHDILIEEKRAILS